MTMEEIKMNPNWNGEGGAFLVDVGYAFQEGTVFQKNYKLAQICYGVAANAGDAQAINNLAWLYQKGLGVDRDVAYAVELYEDAASRGNTRAMVNLGNIYESGELTGEPDYKLAFRWYKEAAEAGDKTGLFNYANCYHWGWGVRKNYKQAISIFSQLADNGHDGAAYYTGLYYQEGYGVKKDYDLARHYYRLGILEGDPFCYNQLGVLYAEGLGIQKDCHAALDYYKKAAEFGDELAYANVGWLYESEELGKPDLEEAIHWYQTGAAKGEEHCLEALERLGLSRGAQPRGTSGLELIQAYRSDPDRFFPMIDQTGQRSAENEYGEKEIGWNAGLLPGNRPYFVESWATDGITWLTFYISTKGIESWTGDEVLHLIQSVGYFQFVNSDHESAENTKFENKKGEEFFSITVTVCIEDEPALIKGASILPWSVLNEYNQSTDCKE